MMNILVSLAMMLELAISVNLGVEVHPMVEEKEAYTIVYFSNNEQMDYYFTEYSDEYDVIYVDHVLEGTWAGEGLNNEPAYAYDVFIDGDWYSITVHADKVSDFMQSLLDEQNTTE